MGITKILYFRELEERWAEKEEKEEREKLKRGDLR